MSVSKKGPVIDGGLCRCCGAIKRCRLLNIEYEWNGVKEVYAEMFLDCFGLCLSHIDGEPSERLICATCVTRLRDASSFRFQVLQCEEKLLQAQIQVDGDSYPHPLTDIKKEPDIKEEDENDESVPDDDHHGDALDEPEQTLQNDIPIEIEVSAWPEPKVKSVSARTRRAARRAAGEDGKKEMLVKLKKMRDKLRKLQGTEAAGHFCAAAGEEGKKDMLVKLKKMRDKLMKLQGTDAAETADPAPPPPVLKPWKSSEQKAFHNASVLVENSYVCPFVTIFSDYHCVYCKELHTDPDKLREHTMTHDPTTYKDNVIYKRSIQIDIARIDCRLCPKPIDNLGDFYTHITTAHDKMLYPNIKNEFLKFRLKLGNLDCLECGMVFTYFHALKRHMAEHFGTWICDVCGAHFFEENKLIMHQKSHQSRKTDDRFPCKDCGKIFKSKHGRYYHISRQHSDTPTYPCYKCDEVFFSYTLRYRHMMAAHGQQRRFPCARCDKVYDTRKSLREHDRKTHLKVLRHECAVCEKKFYLPSALKDHMASHTGERNFRCEYCGKSYPRMRALRVHMQSHATEKKYKCTVCSAAYTQGNNLKHHIRAKHPHVQPE